MSWQDISLVELADVRSGGGAPQDAEAFSNEGNPFVRAGSLVKLLSGMPEEALEKITPQVAREHGLKLFPAGTVLFAKSGMSATKGHIYTLRDEAYVVNHLAALVPHKAPDSAFLSHALQRFSPTGLIKDPAYPSIRLGDIENMKIRAPRDSNDRARIGTILDQADDLRRKRRESIKLLDKLERANFLRIFGDPAVNERNWNRVQFDKLVSKIDSGWSPNCLDRAAHGDEWGVLKLSAVTSGRYIDSEQKALPSDKSPRENIEVHEGDILFTRKNTHSLVAACVLVKKTRMRLMMSDLIFRFRVTDTGALNEYYFQALLMNNSKRKQIQKLANGAAGSMPNISKSSLMSIRVELPPIELQLEFARQAQAIEELRDKNIYVEGQLSNLCASLQHRAFCGEL